ncbi:unnamed protein product, partial [Symbiodinium necroappetens]
DTIENAGWTPPAPSAPPGLSQGNKPTAKAPRDTTRGGKGKGKGRPAASQDSEQPDEAQEALRALFATAADDQKELLLKLGFEAPQEAAPDLTELLKKHIAQLPPAVRAAVEEPPPEPLSAQEQLTDTSRKYKDATTELRLLITRKSALQLKLDKHKKAYNDMLRDMQALDASLKEKQDTVTGLQTELQSSVEAAIAPGGGPDIEAEFFKHLAQLSDDHLQDIKERLCLTIDDAAKRRKVTNATVPDADMRKPPPTALIPADSVEEASPVYRKASGTMGVCHTTGPAYRDYSNCTDFDRPDEAPQANQDLEPASPMAIASAGHNTGTQSTWTSISQTRGPPGQCGPTTRSKPKSLKTKRRRRRQEREHSIPQIHDLAALLRSHSVERPAVHQAAIDLAEWVESERMPEESLESQVAWCVLEHCSGTPGPLDTHTLAAFLDGAEEAYSPEQGEPLQLAVANVTKWRPDILRWFQQTKASCFLGQETHLNSEQTQQARASLAGVGLHSFWAGATEGKQSKGGIVVATPWQSHPRLVQERTVEGCGYLAVELPRVKWRLVVITVYLKAGTGLHVEPNASLLADLMALTKTLPNWVAAGDWNVDVDKFASTNINTTLGAEIIADKAAAISTGNTLDFVLASRSVAPMLTLTVDKAVPFAPHFALNLTLNLEHGMCHLPTLPAFPGPPGPYDTKVVQNYDQDIAGSAPENGVAPPGASCAAPQDQHRLLNGDTLDIGGVKLDNSGTTAAFAALSTSVERSVFNAVHGRGVARPVAYQPLLRDDRAPQRWHGKQLAFLTQTLQALKQCRPLAPLPSEVHKLALGYIEELGPEQEAPAWLATLGVIAGEASPPSADLSKVQLETAIALLTNDEAQERLQVQRSQREDYDLQHRARAQARTLQPLTGAQVAKALRRIPLKAPGPDGWTPHLARALSDHQYQLLADIMRQAELEGSFPEQWCISLVVLLPKNKEIERPIALMHILLKSWMKLRWPLLDHWLNTFAPKAWWDSCGPGHSCLDIAVRRLIQYECTQTRNEHRITLYLDLSCFYETISHSRLLAHAEEVSFPPLLLWGALCAYRGPRLLSADGLVGPPAYASRGVLAGCPAAVALSKVALWPACSQVLNQKAVDTADTWVDDLSVDFCGNNPQQVAAKGLRVARALFQALSDEGLQ